VIRLVNTQLCLRPQGGSTAQGVPLELHQCDPNAPNQNWSIQTQTSGRVTIVNVASGNCLYNNAAVPLVNFARPIDVESCFVSTNPGQLASNSLWKKLLINGAWSFETEVQSKDTGFCLDLPNDVPFDGATFWNFGCNRTAAQLFSIE
jgi:hypothetical protein